MWFFLTCFCNNNLALAQVKTVDQLHVDYQVIFNRYLNHISPHFLFSKYTYSDGSSSFGGAGSAKGGRAAIVSVSIIDGVVLRAELYARKVNEFTNYLGDGTAMSMTFEDGNFELYGMLGSSSAIIVGTTTLTSDGLAGYDAIHASVPVGTKVFFRGMFTLPIGLVVDQSLFDRDFFYFDLQGVLDLSRPAPLSLTGDCNHNKITDVADLFIGGSTDCQGNEILDECEVQSGGDCNENGIPDECEPDCDANGVPDDCDISLFPLSDCNSNGLLDKCEIQSPLLKNFQDGFDASTLDIDDWPVAIDAEVSDSWVYGAPYSLMIRHQGVVESRTFDLSGASSAVLTFDIGAQRGFDSDDHAGVEIWDGAEWKSIGLITTLYETGWQSAIWPLPASALHSQFRFRFRALTHYEGYPEFLHVDNVILSRSLPDCNHNLVLDSCEILVGGSADCQGDLIPDECQDDFDQDQLPDDCDSDIDGDGVDNNLDECPRTPLGLTISLSGRPLADINGNCVLDLPDFAFAADCLTQSGPGVTLSEGSCISAIDLDADGDVDLLDLASFVNRFGVE